MTVNSSVKCNSSISTWSRSVSLTRECKKTKLEEWKPQESQQVSSMTLTSIQMAQSDKWVLRRRHWPKSMEKCEIDSIGRSGRMVLTWNSDHRGGRTRIGFWMTRSESLQAWISTSENACYNLRSITWLTTIRMTFHWRVCRKSSTKLILHSKVRLFHLQQMQVECSQTFIVQGTEMTRYTNCNRCTQTIVWTTASFSKRVSSHPTVTPIYWPLMLTRSWVRRKIRGPIWLVARLTERCAKCKSNPQSR